MDINEIFNLGLDYANSGENHKAIIQFSKVINENPNICEAWFNRGKCKDNINDLIGAVSDFKNCIKINDQFESAYSMITACLFDLNEFDELLKYYNQAINIFPEKSNFYEQRAICYLNLMQYDNALKDVDYAQAIGLDLKVLRETVLTLKSSQKEEKIKNELELDLSRELIPTDVKNAVWNRDNGVCVECKSNKNLEFDHIIPFSKGGANTYRNLQLLCQECNRKKSNKIG